MSAFEWLLAAVLTDMRAQNGGGRKAFDAMWASVWPLSTVNPHVFVQAGRLGETFPAFCALVWTILFMHVENVNAQPITFIKGAVTKGAGELPVSVINTACIFKMALTIVLVGKNFTTTMTRVD